MRINNGSGIPSLLLVDLVKPVNRVVLRNNALLEAVVIAAVMVVDADCVGAIMVLPDGDRPCGNADSGYSPMTPGDLQRVIGALDVAPLGAAPERGFRPSLAGFQRKALLGRAGDGTWQLPSGDAPSTWILKPDGPNAMAANEATCLRLAAGCGLLVLEAELLDGAGRLLYLVGECLIAPPPPSGQG